MKSSRILAVAWLLVLPPAALGQEAQALLNGTLDRSSEGLEGVSYYVERVQGGDMSSAFTGFADTATGCRTNCTVYKVEQVEYPDGPRNVSRVLSPLEVKVLLGDSPGADLMEEYGKTMVIFQEKFNRAIGGHLGPAGGAIEGLDPMMNPLKMFGAAGYMYMEGAQGLREAERSLATSAEQAQSESDDVAAVMGQLEDRGTDVVGEVGARYFAADIDMPPQTVEDQTMEFDRAEIWIDPANLVLVKHRFAGTATQADGQSREFFIEVVNSDFREPATCDAMYAPYRRTLRMGGMMDDAQMAEMEEARRQLEEFDRQMASMPPDQRRLMENMMGSQMDTVRSLSSGGAIEHVQEMEEILCDPDLAALFGGGTGTAGQMIAGYDLVVIQRYLVVLGYEPGNTEGTLDTMTQVAISQFQAERGLPVTGEPSAELQRALATEAG